MNQSNEMNLSELKISIVIMRDSCFLFNMANFEWIRISISSQLHEHFIATNQCLDGKLF